MVMVMVMVHASYIIILRSPYILQHTKSLK